MIVLRKCRDEDFEFYYSLKCEPTSLRWGGFTTPPEKARLLGHYTTVFINPSNKQLLIIEEDGLPLGYIQLSFEGQEVELAITVAERYAGHGVATAAYKYLFESYEGIRGYRPFAYIRDDNMPSIRSLSRYGFERTDIYDERYFPADGRDVRLYRYERTEG